MSYTDEVFTRMSIVADAFVFTTLVGLPVCIYFLCFLAKTRVARRRPYTGG